MGQLCFGINGEERPNLANLVPVVVTAKIILLFADESPDLVNLDPVAGEIYHLVIEDTRASLTKANAEAHHGIAVNSRHALNAADAASFCGGARGHGFLSYHAMEAGSNR